MSHQFKLILWDFDGTLADTLSNALATYNRLAAKHGDPTIPESDTDAVRDMTIRQILKAYGIPMHRVPSLFAGFLAEQKRGPAAPLYAGISDTVRQISSAGIRQGVVSSNSAVTIDRSLKAADLRPVFDCVVATSRLFGKSKGLRKAAKTEGLAPEEILYVGDEVRDIEAARAVGIPIASVTWGLNSEGLLRKHEPDWVMERPGDLSDMLNGKIAAGR